ncbi:hypothetical protein AVEN_132268-1 [Araneus ventricosus]|uniref:Uncharacterized protein n=1 Tax=Araneus ventricosus TaxID=182803 RepID=A0A4Y2PZX6_ARAVE|nr:hypothetical protein AVEN_132268-1 [Araneus ventricosus]
MDLRLQGIIVAGSKEEYDFINSYTDKYFMSKTTRQEIRTVSKRSLQLRQKLSHCSKIISELEKKSNVNNSVTSALLLDGEITVGWKRIGCWEICGS